MVYRRAVASARVPLRRRTRVRRPAAAGPGENRSVERTASSRAASSELAVAAEPAASVLVPADAAATEQLQPAEQKNAGNWCEQVIRGVFGSAPCAGNPNPSGDGDDSSGKPAMQMPGFPGLPGLPLALPGMPGFTWPGLKLPSAPSGGGEAAAAQPQPRENSGEPGPGSDSIPWFRAFFWTPTSDQEARESLLEVVQLIGCARPPGFTRSALSDRTQS